MKPVDKLINLLRKDKVIPVVGAGVSFAAAGLPSWRGVIENGLTYAEDRRVVEKDFIDQARVFLRSGDLIKAADHMKMVLNAPNHPYADWLEDLFGTPIVQSMELLNSIHDLCTPILLTTNYDDLLYAPYKIQEKKVFDWSVHGQIARALNKGEEFILHLHGIYQKPDTVILSSADYARLAHKKGYKAILQKLWTDYHFIFIGCSRDGIMDPDFTTVLDFMNKWFPDLPHEHFILMREPEFEKKQHQGLLEKCNVHPISYGAQYDDLPGFINHVNPNLEKARLRIEMFLEEINAGFKRLNVTGKLTSDQSAVNMFVKNSLPVKAYWIDSIELKMLEDVLKNHNAHLNNKRQQLAGSQAIVRGLISINKLEKYIELWNKNWHDPEKLRKSSMIDTAVIAFNCLKAFPQEMLDEIRLRAPSAIHGLYFNRHFDQFINEIKLFRAEKDHDLEEVFADRYFFENLKRIIQSLQGVLSLDPKKVFPELAEAVITPKTNFGLLFLAGHEISLRSDEFPYAIQATLPGESSLPFNSADFIGLGSEQFVLGHTSQYCFTWNPHKDLSPRIFYTAEIGGNIDCIINSKEGTDLYTYIFSGKTLLTFKNLRPHLQTEIQREVHNVVLLPERQGFLSSVPIAANIRGTFISRITLNGEMSPLLTVEELWDLINDIPAVYEVLRTITSDKMPSLINGFIQGTRIKDSRWFGEQVITLTATISLQSIKSSFLIVFRFEQGKLTVLSRVFFPHRFCYSHVLMEHSDRMDLIAGYLDTGPFPLVQYFKGINRMLDTTIDGQPAIIQRLAHENADILAIQAITPNRVILIQENDKLYDVSLPDLTARYLAVEHLFKVAPILAQS